MTSMCIETIKPWDIQLDLVLPEKHLLHEHAMFDPIFIIMIVAAFNEVPSPMLEVVILDEQRTYKCSHSTANRISWEVNDRVLGVQIFTIPGIEYTESDIFSHPDDTIYTLTIRALPQNNDTTIQCTAAFLDGFPSQYTPIVTFLIQGQLIIALYLYL